MTPPNNPHPRLLPLVKAITNSALSHTAVDMWALSKKYKVRCEIVKYYIDEVRADYVVSNHKIGHSRIIKQKTLTE